jgi:2-polyprenyl-6-methoxyphenol hydroxylase-like FAD-dependent oxidoreductase
MPAHYEIEKKNLSEYVLPTFPLQFQQMPMRIIIVGAGIAGISTYLLLKKHILDDPSSNLKNNISITIYESHHLRIDNADNKKNRNTSFEELSSSTALVGGGLGIAPNGMRILRDLDEKLHDEILKRGFVVEHAILRSARGWNLGKIRWGDMREPEEFCVSIARHRLWECLRDAVGEDVIQYKKVAGVKNGMGGKSVVTFADGSADEEVDLVIGADGVKSIVRKAIFGDKYPPFYECVQGHPEKKNFQLTYSSRGLLGVGGFINAPPPPTVQQDKSMVFTFGPNGFFGYSASGDKETMWWSTCEGEDVPEKTKIDPEDMRDQLKNRHGNWKDPNIQEILDKADVGSIYPTWTTPLLPHWGTDGLVLVGDAAHALQPTSGQGSSQAMEDGMTYSLLLKKFLGQCSETGGNGELSVTDACNMASKAYFEIRGPRIANIVKRTQKVANQKKDLTFMQEMTVYFFIWLIDKFPLTIRELTSSSPSRQGLS